MQIRHMGKVWDVNIRRTANNDSEVSMRTPDNSDHLNVSVPKSRFPQQAAMLGNNPKVVFVLRDASEALAEAGIFKKSCYVSGTSGNVVVGQLLVDVPQFAHDCDGCNYLGTHTDEGKLADLYFCGGRGGHDTVIARFSDDGPDYISGMGSAKTSPLLTEAKKRAVDKGLL